MQQNDRPEQNNKKYTNFDYETFNLWVDYWTQLSLIKEQENIKKILEIGKGTGTMGLLLTQRGYQYKSADVEKSLNPDYVCDITKIPVRKNSFDVVCAFQVLEHIPYTDFEIALKEMTRIAKKQVIVSIPFSTVYISFGITFFYAKIIDSIFNLLKFKPFEPKWFNFFLPTFFLENQGMISDHSWEMGRKGYSRNRIRNSINNAGLKIVKEFPRDFYPYHYYMVLEPK